MPRSSAPAFRLGAAVPLAIAALASVASAQVRGAARCAPDNGGITLPAGFCASVFADSLPGPRHLQVAPNGDVVVALTGTNRGGQRTSGGVMVLRDADGDGRAEAQRKFGEFNASEVALFDGHLYTETSTAILRYPFAAGAMEPSGGPDTVVGGLPAGGHMAKTFTIGRDGALYVNVGSRTNSCQERDRAANVKGVDPCTELETRAGIWRFDARKLGQTQTTGARWATGIRNAVAITTHPRDGALWVMQHGRDQLSGNWPALFDSVESAETPAEEMFRVSRGDDFGWPYCYYDGALRKKVLAPEYGGDGKTVGRCAGKKGNVAAFPAHWAPNGLLFYTGTTFPAKYRSGAFIAFHGSWNRAPLPQAGFNVVFQPMQGDRAAGAYEVFADGFVSDEVRGAARAGQAPPTAKRHRPTGLAQGPDGALYMSDDSMGRIWRVVHVGASR
jgi:glucose/arabinose dehydrogenase